MTSATHGLDSAPKATTVAELLARNGMVPGRRSRSKAEATDRFLPVPAPAGQFSSAPGSAAGKFDGSLSGLTPLFDPMSREHVDDDTPTMQYRYDKTALTAMLADEAPSAVPERKPRNGRKIAGIAFAGAVLFGGFGLLTTTQSPDDHDASASGVQPTNNNTPEASLPRAAAPIGAEVVGLAGAPTGTAEIPAPPAPQPSADTNSGKASSGSSSGKAKTTSKAAPKHAAPAPKAATPPQFTMPQLPSGTYVWPYSPNGHGMHHVSPGGGKHRRR